MWAKVIASCRGCPGSSSLNSPTPSSSSPEKFRLRGWVSPKPVWIASKLIRVSCLLTSSLKRIFPHGDPPSKTASPRKWPSPSQLGRSSRNGPTLPRKKLRFLDFWRRRRCSPFCTSTGAASSWIESFRPEMSLKGSCFPWSKPES